MEYSWRIMPITNLANDSSVHIHYSILEILKNEIYNGSLKFSA
jgi:hypothetical protein